MDTHGRAGERILILISLVMTGVTLSSLTHLPAWRVELSVLGSPLSLGVSGSALLTVALVALTAVGVSEVVQAETGRAHLGVRYMSTFWILPCLVTLAAALAIPRQFDQVGDWLASVVLLTGLLAAVIVAEYGSVNLSGRFYRGARLGLNLATYAAAFALYAAIYGLQVRSLVSGTVIFVVTFLLALELLRGTEEQLATTWLYAAIIALVCAEVTWALNRWGLSSLAGGGLLLIAFYTMSGVSQQYLAGRATRRVVLEFATIGLVGVVIVWLSSPWLTAGP